MDAAALGGCHRGAPAGGCLCGGAEGGILTSTDGVCWSFDRQTEQSWRTVAFGSGRTLLTGDFGYRAVSTLPGVWEVSEANTYAEQLVFGLDRFVGHGGSGWLFSSADGVDWTYSYPDRALSVKRLSFVNNRFLALAREDKSPQANAWAALSQDGKSWTWQQTNLPGAEIDQGGLIAVGGEYLFAASKVYASSDGLHWKVVREQDLRGALPMGDRFVRPSGQSFTVSFPGEGWREESFSVPDRFRAIAYGAGRYLVAGENGTILISAREPDPAAGLQVRFTAACSLYSANGRPQPLNAYALVRDGQVLVPAAPLAEALGLSPASLTWDDAAQRLTVQREGSVITLTVDQLPTLPFKGYGQLYMPVAPIAEALGFQVEYDPAGPSVLLTHKP